MSKKEKKPEPKVTQAQPKNEYQEQFEHLKLTMVTLSEMSAVGEYKAESDRIANALLDTLKSFEFTDPDPMAQVVMMNRAVGYVHSMVQKFFSDAAANFTLHEKKAFREALAENRELKIKYEHLQDTFSECMLGLREVAVLSIHPKERAKNWNSKKSKKEFKDFIKGEKNGSVHKSTNGNKRKLSPKRGKSNPKGRSKKVD